MTRTTLLIALPSSSMPQQQQFRRQCQNPHLSTQRRKIFIGIEKFSEPVNLPICTGACSNKRPSSFWLQNNKISEAKQALEEIPLPNIPAWSFPMLDHFCTTVYMLLQRILYDDAFSRIMKNSVPTTDAVFTLDQNRQPYSEDINIKAATLIKALKTLDPDTLLSKGGRFQGLCCWLQQNKLSRANYIL